MTGERKILVLVDPKSGGLSALHHALALAERIRARVVILRVEPLGEKTPLAGWVDDALFEIMTRAREAGVTISCNTLRDRSEEAVLGFVRDQGIDVLVVGEHERHWEKDLLHLRSGRPTQIIRVKEKNESGARAGRKRA